MSGFRVSAIISFSLWMPSFRQSFAARNNSRKYARLPGALSFIVSRTRYSSSSTIRGSQSSPYFMSSAIQGNGRNGNDLRTSAAAPLTEIMIEEFALPASKRDVPYQSLIKVFLSERIEEEIKAWPLPLRTPR
jgi:hypothetical protein